MIVYVSPELSKRALSANLDARRVGQTDLPVCASELGGVLGCVGMDVCACSQTNLSVRAHTKVCVDVCVGGYGSMFVCAFPSS